MNKEKCVVFVGIKQNLWDITIKRERERKGDKEKNVQRLSGVKWYAVLRRDVLDTTITFCTHDYKHTFDRGTQSIRVCLFGEPEAGLPAKEELPVACGTIWTWPGHRCISTYLSHVVVSGASAKGNRKRRKNEKGSFALSPVFPRLCHAPELATNSSLFNAALFSK